MAPPERCGLRFSHGDLLVQLLRLALMTELLAVSRAEPLLDLIQRFVVVVEEPIRLNPL